MNRPKHKEPNPLHAWLLEAGIYHPQKTVVLWLRPGFLPRKYQMIRYAAGLLPEVMQIDIVAPGYKVVRYFKMGEDYRSWEQVEVPFKTSTSLRQIKKQLEEDRASKLWQAAS